VLLYTALLLFALSYEISRNTRLIIVELVNAREMKLSFEKKKDLSCQQLKGENDDGDDHDHKRSSLAILVVIMEPSANDRNNSKMLTLLCTL